MCGRGRRGRVCCWCPFELPFALHFVLHKMFLRRFLPLRVGGCGWSNRRAGQHRAQTTKPHTSINSRQTTSSSRRQDPGGVVGPRMPALWQDRTYHSILFPNLCISFQDRLHQELVLAGFGALYGGCLQHDCRNTEDHIQRQSVRQVNNRGRQHRDSSHQQQP